MFDRFGQFNENIKPLMELGEIKMYKIISDPTHYCYRLCNLYFMTF